MAEVIDGKFADGYVIGEADHDSELARLRLQGQTGFDAYSAAFFYLVARPEDCSVILNQGAGAGGEWGYIGPLAGRIRAVDTNPQNGYAANIDKFNLQDRIEYVVGDASRLEHIASESITMAAQRLFWQHLRVGDRQRAGEEMVRVLVPGGLVVAEDIDFRKDLWKITPDSKALSTLQDAMLALYEKGGYEPAMGPKLVSFLEGLGLQITEERTYSITTRHTQPFKMAHFGILNSIAPALIARGIMPAEEVQQNLGDLRTDLNKPGMLITSPTVYQVAARKPLS